VLPNEEIRWRDVWIGALFAAILMILGGIIFGAYIRVSHFGSAFEAAGVFIVILTGMYYFAQIFLFGAMFTRVYALTFGSKQ
jgi:membrane protein